MKTVSAPLAVMWKLSTLEWFVGLSFNKMAAVQIIALSAIYGMACCFVGGYFTVQCTYVRVRYTFVF